MFKGSKVQVSRRIASLTKIFFFAFPIQIVNGFNQNDLEETNTLILKETVSRDFRLLVFFKNLLAIGPWLTL
jgi:hypothetical protein